jgi:hypothetical protein
MKHTNIQHRLRYTELAPVRFRDFWRDYLGVALPAIATASPQSFCHDRRHLQRPVQLVQLCI